MLTPATQLLSFVIIFVYAWMLIVAPNSMEGLLLFQPQTLLEHGAASPIHIWHGDSWRIFTALFLHGGFLHLFFNLFVLRQIGPLLEPTLGTARFLLLFLASGLGSFGFSLYINGQLAVGASGGLFGLIGGLLVLSFFARHETIGFRLFIELLVVIALNLVIGGMFPIIDNAAHLGGLIIGIILGAGLLADRSFIFFTAPPKEEKDVDDAVQVQTQKLGSPRMATWGSSLGLTVCVLFLVLGFKPTDRVHYHVTQAHDAIDYGKKDKLDKHLNLAQLIDPLHPSVALVEARVFLHNNQPNKAKPLLVAALSNLNQSTNHAWGVALRHIAPTANTDQQLFHDAHFTNALCDEALALTLTEPVIELINNCAWFLLTTKNPQYHKPSKAIQLARFAVEKAGADVPPAILHTLAEAEAQTGRPEEAMVMMEKLLLEQGLQQRDYYQSEYKRFVGLTQSRKKQTSPQNVP
ncbi:MAG: hypothetical protein CMH56_11620 [Myxococcales bacterium]|nr:hypothetical protein [Myxococcales bacterium]|tara:strand:- start:2295 stop:3689 length:1395 start_codon:yes stop_codon:yes gene_type:complete